MSHLNILGSELPANWNEHVNVLPPSKSVSQKIKSLCEGGRNSTAENTHYQSHSSADRLTLDTHTQIVDSAPWDTGVSLAFSSLLSAALSAWANLLIGWENPHRGSYWSLQPRVTSLWKNSMWGSRAVIQWAGRSIFKSGLHPVHIHMIMFWLLTYRWLVFLLALCSTLNLKSYPSGLDTRHRMYFWGK